LCVGRVKTVGVKDVPPRPYRGILISPTPYF
jgi:hypothetical protein